MPTRTAGATLGPQDVIPTTHTIVAAFPSIESARTAADALAAVSIPADKITLAPAETGPIAQHAAPYQFDERREVSTSVASGAIIGGLAGAVGALAVAGLVSAIANIELGAFVLLSAMLFGGVGVGAIGGFMSGSTLDKPQPGGPSDAWPRVNVECEGDLAAAAIKVLRQRGPLELFRDEEQLA